MTGQGDEGLIRGQDGVVRCFWSGNDSEYQHYHDTEWGHPAADDSVLFEKICLEGFQSGLSWLTILRKRDRFREVFEEFDFIRIARFGPEDVERLMADPGIVRHRGKIESTINNARRAIDLADEFGSLGAFFWQWEPETSARPERLDYHVLRQLGKTPESTAMSKALKNRGWSFVGPTTAYAFMQAMGMVNDHIEGCFRRPDVETARARFERPAATP